MARGPGGPRGDRDVHRLFAWDRLTAHEWKRADRLVSEAERGPANVIYLTDQIRADHRERRLLRLLERG